MNITFFTPYIKKVEAGFSLRYLWVVSFFLALIIFILLVLFDIYVFFAYAISWQDNIPEPEITTVILEKDALQKSVQILEKRNQRFLKVGEEGLPISDPFR